MYSPTELLACLWYRVIWLEESTSSFPKVVLTYSCCREPHFTLTWNVEMNTCRLTPHYHYVSGMNNQTTVASWKIHTWTCLYLDLCCNDANFYLVVDKCPNLTTPRWHLDLKAAFVFQQNGWAQPSSAAPPLRRGCQHGCWCQSGAGRVRRRRRSHYQCRTS